MKAPARRPPPANSALAPTRRGPAGLRAVISPAHPRDRPAAAQPPQRGICPSAAEQDVSEGAEALLQAASLWLLGAGVQTGFQAGSGRDALAVAVLGGLLPREHGAGAPRETGAPREPALSGGSNAVTAHCRSAARHTPKGFCLLVQSKGTEGTSDAIGKGPY